MTEVPKFLKNWDKIAVITPSWDPDVDLLYKGIAVLENAGFIVEFMRNDFGKRGTLAPLSVRVSEVNRAFCKPDFKAVIFSRGGYGAMHLIPYIEYECLQRYPKWIIGYSDATALFSAIEKKTGLSYIHGPMVESIGKSTEGTETLIKLLKGEIPEYSISQDTPEVKGNLSGGCLSLIVSLLGTPYEMDFKDKVVFLEDVGEKDYRIDRMLTQLKLAGKLDDAKMFIVGGEENYGVYEDILGKTGKPYIIGFPAGHGFRNYPMIMNVMAEIKDGKLRFLI